MPDYLGTSVFISFDGDKIGREIGRASLANDPEGLRRLSQAIEKGNEIWGSWAVNCGGTIISLGGDEGRLEAPADRLADLPSLQAQYQSAVGAPCSVGVGLELSQADKALLYAKMHGGARVCFYTPDVDEEVQELADRQNHRSEISKIADEYLGKAEAPGPAQPQHENQSASGSQGMQARQQLGAAQAQQMDAPAAPPLPGETPMEQRLHEHAKKQKGQDGATLAVQQQQNGREAMRQQVVKVLKQVKAAAPLLEEAKAQSPQIYKAVLGAVQAMVAMAKQMTGGVAPEGGAPGASQGQEGSSETQDQEVAKSERLEKMACIHDSTTKPMTVYRVQNADGEGPYEAWHKPNAPAAMNAAMTDRLAPLKMERIQPSPNRDFSNDYQAYKDVEKRQGLYGFEKPEHAEEWFGREGMRKLRMLGFNVVPVQAGRVHRSMTGKQVLFHPFGKAELPMPSAPAHAAPLNLPVGSSRDGKIKVRHADGTSSWVEVRSGIVMSQDGHAISSLRPGGR